MKASLAALALLTLAAPATAQTIEVGRANWANMPKLQAEEGKLAYGRLVSEVELMLREKKCELKGQTARRFDITVPYAVLLEPSGQLSRILVNEMRCAPLETLVGEVAIALANTGAIKPGGAGQARWYSSEINFTLQ